MIGITGTKPPGQPIGMVGLAVKSDPHVPQTAQATIARAVPTTMFRHDGHDL
jgi:hypothetical protein